MCKEKKIHNPVLSEELARVTGSDCYKCEDLGRKQNFTLTGSYIDDGQGVYPLLFCNNCQEERESGDGDFHEFYNIVEEDNSVWIEDKEGAQLV